MSLTCTRLPPSPLGASTAEDIQDRRHGGGHCQTISPIYLRARQTCTSRTQKLSLVHWSDHLLPSSLYKNFQCFLKDVFVYYIFYTCTRLPFFSLVDSTGGNIDDRRRGGGHCQTISPIYLRARQTCASQTQKLSLLRWSAHSPHGSL